jgi:hypothetical protein
MNEKFKSFILDDAIFYAILVVTVAIVAFLLGRNSVVQIQPQGAGVQMSQQAVPLSERAPAAQIDTAVVVSRSGTKYHLPTCPGAKQIKESNKITFSSIAEAKAAGYAAAANCAGLE